MEEADWRKWFMCTCITCENGAFYFGRNLDLDVSFGEHVVITPRRFPLHFTGMPVLKEHYAMIGMAAGTVFMAFIGCFLNAYVLLPAYAKAFSMPIDALVGMGTAVNGHITNLLTFVVFAVAPFNLLKGAMVSVVVLLIYKKISPILKMR